MGLLARGVTRALATPDGQSLPPSVRRRALTAVRQTLLLSGDPVVSYRIGDIELALPLSHDLPAIRGQYPDYSNNLVRLVSTLAQAMPVEDIAVVDIGANIGDTVALVRQAGRCPVLCLEADPGYFELLTRNTAALPDVERELVLVGTGEVTGHVLQRAKGSAGLVATGSASGQRTDRLRDILARHPRFARPRLVKIDTDGFDGLILEAELDWLAETTPVLFWEYAPFLWPAGHAGEQVFGKLRAAGYGTVLVYESTGHFRQTIALQDEVALEDMHAAALGWGRAHYLDIAAFPAKDEALARQLRALELQRAHAAG